MEVGTLKEEVEVLESLLEDYAESTGYEEIPSNESWCMDVSEIRAFFKICKEVAPFEDAPSVRVSTDFLRLVENYLRDYKKSIKKQLKEKIKKLQAQVKELEE